MELLRQYGVATTIVFPVETAASTALAASGDWTPATGDTKISKDGGNVANTGANPAAVGGTGSVLWTLVLTATEMQAAEITIQIVDTALKDQVIKIGTRLGGQIAANGGIIVGEVDDATDAPTTTTAEAFRIAPNTTEETTADHYNGRTILFTSGVAAGSLSNITDYALVNSKEFYTWSPAVATAPADGDSFVVL